MSHPPVARRAADGRDECASGAWRAVRIWLLLAVVAAAVFYLSLRLGSVRISGGELLRALLPGEDNLAARIVRQLRLPRAAAGFACGALLSLSGALLQVLLRNPLADPYILGVSGGAAVCALLAMTLALPFWGVQACAFGGACAAIALVLGAARGALLRGEPAEASPRLLLTGVVLAAGWGALISLLLALAPNDRLRGMLFWLAGDLDGVGSAGAAWAALAVALAASLPAAPRLNALLRGETVAAALGVATGALRLRVFLVASLATACAVTLAGSIGFVGLVVPHVLRLAFGNDQRVLLPAAALGGGALVMGADLIARTALAPVQLPVGVITALLGVPAFLWMLSRRLG